jgi:hypothetical protein
MEPKDCGSQQVHRKVLEDGTKIYEVIEEVGSYFEKSEHSITKYTRTNPTFHHDQETIFGE